MQDRTTAEAINRLIHEVSDSIHKIRDTKAMLTDVAEQNDEWRDLQEDIKELNGKKNTAKKLLESDKDYQAVHADLQELKFKHKDLLEILSHHLVTYYSETDETTFTMDDGTVLQIVITAKPTK